MVSFLCPVIIAKILMNSVFRDEQDCAVSCSCSVVERDHERGIGEEHKI